MRSVRRIPAFVALALVIFGLVVVDRASRPDTVVAPDGMTAASLTHTAQL
ncbi:MAG: hypothetical protein RJB08_1102, partial [Actinomycetota bacterium]